MQLTWFGHASVRLVTDGGITVYVDPYAGEDAWYDKPADLVLVTHDHFDHFKTALLKRIQVDSTVLAGPAAVARQYHGFQAINENESKDFGKVVVRAVPAYNIRKSYHPRGQGVGFLIEIEGKTVYVAGDTDFIPEMRNFRADIVAVPVGGTYTMNAREAAEMVNGMRPHIAIPYHWGRVAGTVVDARMFADLVGTGGDIIVKVLEPRETVEA